MSDYFCPECGGYCQGYPDYILFKCLDCGEEYFVEETHKED